LSLIQVNTRNLNNIDIYNVIKTVGNKKLCYREKHRASVVSKLRLIICQISAIDRRALHFSVLVGVYKRWPGESSVSAFIEIFSTTDGRSQSMQSGSKSWTGLRSTFGEFGNHWGMFV